jgi:predicted small lipoprotein YifL
MTTRDLAQLRFAQFWGRWGLYVKQSINRWSRVGFKIALAAVLTGALGLAACGRKGPLDPPPSAALPQSPAPAYTPRPGLGEEHYGTPPGAPTTAAPTAAVAAPATGGPPPQKTFFLDFLLGK